MKNNQSLNNIPVWQESLDLVKSMYVLTGVFPDEEKMLLSKQLKKNAISVSSGIAKALTSNTDNRLQYLEEAQLSLIEIETLLNIALKLNYLTQEDIDSHFEKYENIQMHVNALIHKLNKVT